MLPEPAAFPAMASAAPVAPAFAGARINSARLLAELINGYLRGQRACIRNRGNGLTMAGMSTTL